MLKLFVLSQIFLVLCLQEELSAKLLEFLESPHATTDVLLADKEQVLFNIVFCATSIVRLLKA